MEHSNGETGGTPPQCDNEDVSVAVHITGDYLPFAVEALWSDREIVLAAVNNVGAALQYAPEELLSDREVVLTAVTNNGEASQQYASEELRSDREVVLAAVNGKNAWKTWPASWICTLEELRCRRQVALLKHATGDLFDCTLTTNESIGFVQDILQTLQEKEFVSIILVANVWEICPNLKGVLKRLGQELKNSDIDFSSCGDMSPVDVAKRWTARLRITQLCHNACTEHARTPRYRSRRKGRLQSSPSLKRSVFC